MVHLLQCLGLASLQLTCHGSHICKREEKEEEMCTCFNTAWLLDVVPPYTREHPHFILLQFLCIVYKERNWRCPHAKVKVFFHIITFRIWLC